LLAHGSRADRLPACANCHALRPKHDFIAPCLESQQAGYLEKQLNDFKAGRRRNDPQAVMQKIAQRLPQPDVAVLSEYLASLERPAPGSACAGEER
jgi:cytochrome c553